MVWQYVNTLYHAVLAHIACGGKKVLVIVIDTWSDDMAHPHRLAYALQIFHHLMRMSAVVRGKALMQFIVHGLYIKKYKVRNLKKTTYSIIEDDTAGVQCCVYAFLFAQTEVFLHKGYLNKRFATSAGDTASLYEITILKGFFQ